jgi:hypothetical protein
MVITGPSKSFVVAKYLIYSLLALDVWLFLEEEIQTVAAAGTVTSSLESLVTNYSSSLDTASWLLILILFEIETFWISDEAAKGSAGRKLRAVRSWFYLVPAIAFFGYWSELQSFYDVAVLEGDPCRLVNNGIMIMTDLDVFEPITMDNCLSYDEWFTFANSESAVTTASGLENAREYMLSELLNAGGWLVVVSILHLETKGLLGRSENFTRFSKLIWLVKAMAYSVIFGALTYWYLIGDGLNFMDGILWLLAFFCVENNVVTRRRNLSEA